MLGKLKNFVTNQGGQLNFSSDIQVSVLITFYNQKDSIERTLLSVLNQKTNFNYEILVGDDGSTDGTYECLKEWELKYNSLIQVFRMPRAKSVKYEPIVRVSNNRHNLLVHAKGKYLTFLDGDDYYTNENKLQIQKDILDSDPKLSACCHPFKMVWDNGQHEDKICGQLSSNYFSMSWKIYWLLTWIHAECFLFKNSYKNKENLINKNLFDDNLITLYFIKSGNIAYTPENMINYVQHESSSWNERSEIEKAYANMMLYQEANKIIPKYKFLTFFKLQSVFSSFYKSRNANLNFNYDQTFKLTNLFFIETQKYFNSSIYIKFLYHLKYFVPCHLSLLKRTINKFIRVIIKLR